MGRASGGAYATDRFNHVVGSRRGLDAADRAAQRNAQRAQLLAKAEELRRVHGQLMAGLDDATREMWSIEFSREAGDQVRYMQLRLLVDKQTEHLDIARAALDAAEALVSDSESWR